MTCVLLCLKFITLFPNKYPHWCHPINVHKYICLCIQCNHPPLTTSFSLSILYILERKKSLEKVLLLYLFLFQQMIINHETKYSVVIIEMESFYAPNNLFNFSLNNIKPPFITIAKTTTNNNNKRKLLSVALKINESYSQKLCFHT